MVIIVKNFIKNNWLVLLLTAIISAIYISCTTPGMTWVGFDCDLGDFLYAAKYGAVLHFPGFPVYSMLSWLAVRVPIGTESFRLALIMSTIPAIITCVLVYLVVKKQTVNKWAPYVGMLSMAGANILMMQAIIPEVYSFTAMLVAFTYTFIIYKKFRLAAIFGGLTCAMHWMAVPAVIGFFFLSSDFRKKWKYIVISFVIPYFYVVFMGLTHESFSIQSGSKNEFVQYVFGALHENMQWWLDIPIWDVPEKFLTLIYLFSVAFGLSLIPMVKYLWDWRKSKILLTSIIIPLIYFFGCVTGITIVHVVIVVPFLAIAAGLGVDKLKKINPKLICLVSLILLCLMPMKYDIGRTLDKGMATEGIYNSFYNLSDGDIVVSLGRMDNGKDDDIGGIFGRGNTLLHIFNIENNRSIVPISMSDYCGNSGRVFNEEHSDSCREKLRSDYGINTPFIYDANLSDIELYWATVNLIADENPDSDIYYTLLHEDDPFARELIKYENQ